MEDITMIRNKSSQSGQIFVLGSLLIAVILVSLAFSLNMVIYSENTAARGSTVAESNAIDHYESVNTLSSRNIEAHNQALYMDRSTIRTANESSLDQIFSAEKKRQTRKSTLVDVNYSSTYGILLAQDDMGREFTAEDDTKNWDLVRQSESIHKFKQTVDTASLSSASSTDISNNGLGGINALTMEIGSERVRIYEFQDNGNIRVHVQGESPCTITGSPSEVKINYIEATVNGNYCPQLDFVEGNNHTVSIRNGDTANGVYGIMIGNNAPESSIDTNNFVDRNASNENPYYHHVIINTDYETYYDGPKQTASNSGSSSATLPSDTQ